MTSKMVFLREAPGQGQLSRVLLLNSSSKHGGKEDKIVYPLRFKSII